MANEQNLRRDLSPSEAREYGSRGGKRSAEVRREKKRLRESLEALLEGEIEIDGQKVSVTDAMAAAAIKSALRGDWKAWELVRDTSGQKPIDKVVTAEVDPDVIEDVERMVMEDNTEDDDEDGSG